MSVFCLTFSRDRPMQLDALLTSIEQHAPFLYDPMLVLYCATEPQYEHGYEICAKAHPGAEFLREVDFYLQVSAVLTANRYVAFQTDDDVFYRDLDLANLRLDLDEICFSLRLGLNIHHCYPYAATQPQPSDLRRRRGILYWRWPHAAMDWSYPMSLDGHIFWSEMLRRLLGSRRFSNPNQLEEILAQTAWVADGEYMLCLRESAVVSLPLNRVNTTHANRYAENPWWSPERLNERYLLGERFNLKAMDFSTIEAAHQIVIPSFAAPRKPVRV